MTLRIVAATANPAKVAALRRLAGPLATVQPSPHDISLETREADEDVEAIAATKAVAASRALGDGTLVVATDGGLLIPALGDRWNPTRTRRFAPAAGSDLDRANALLAPAAHLTGEARRIGWREALAVARNGQMLAAWTAESPPGLLAETVDADAVAAGAGFWVPAIWRCPEFDGKLLADLTPEERASRPDHWTELGERLRAFLAAQETPDHAEEPGAPADPCGRHCL